MSYDKRRSLKGNVYYVSFASDADIAYADRISKRLRNITLKPFQPRYASEVQRESSIKICNHQESVVLSSGSPPSLSSISTLHTSNLAKEQLINDVQLCLNSIKMARQVTDELYQLY
ncbi:unnamed protein product, partial [Rotaria sordida]